MDSFEEKCMRFAVEEGEICPGWGLDRQPMISVSVDYSRCNVKCAPSDLARGKYLCPHCNMLFPKTEKKFLEFFSSIPIYKPDYDLVPVAGLTFPNK